MLKKRNRLTSNDVEMLFKHSKTAFSDNLSFKYMFKKDQTPSLVSFIAPKTASKQAVTRNLLRRRGYAVFKGYFDTLPQTLIGAFVFGKQSKEVFGGKKTKNSNPIENLDNEIKKILNKIN